MIRDQNVVGLDVTVYHAARVSVVERVRDLTERVHGVADRQLPVPRQAGPERLAPDQGHCVIEQVVRAAGREQRHDVWVLQRGRQLDLAMEPLGVDPCGELRRQDLDHHAPAQLGLLGEEHTAHPTAAELPLQAVPPSEDGLQAVADVHKGAI